MAILDIQRHVWPVLVFFVALPGWALAQAPAPAQAPATPPLQAIPSQASYGIGRQIGQQIGGQLSRSGLEGDLVDMSALLLGIQDALSGGESRITQAQFEAAMGQVEATARQRMQQKMQASAERNRRDGPKFLEKYKALEGVQQTASGLLYKALTRGNGPSPKPTDIVRTHYRGRLVDGTEFDSSYKRNEPALFPVNQVIPGWTEALQMMKVGDRWQLVVPPELAYGEQGSPPVIGPHAVLIFDIELLAIEQPEEGLPGADQPQRP
jgi:FKBP-type peptidyl-prolyl cis-trans isomerase